MDGGRLGHRGHADAVGVPVRGDGLLASESRAKIKTNMRVTIGQINTTNGDYEANTAAIIRAIEFARKDK